MAADPKRIWTEALIQDCVYLYCASRSHEIVVPNSRLFAWESDVISLTNSGLIHEFEIKISRSDFFADRKKLRTRVFTDPDGAAIYKNFLGPNYFWYVTPEGLINLPDLPRYAGLIEIGNSDHAFTPQVQKYPMRAHRETIRERQRWQLARATNYRYWRERISKASI